MVEPEVIATLQGSVRRAQKEIAVLGRFARSADECDGHILVDRLNDTVTELEGWLLELQDAVETLQDDATSAHKTLAQCQSLWMLVNTNFNSRLVSFEAINELRRLGRLRGDEWTRWVSSVEGTLEDCRQPLEAIQLALLAAWESLSHHAPQVVITNTNANHLSSDPGTMARPRQALSSN